MDLQPWVEGNRAKLDEMIPATIPGGRERFVRNMIFQVGVNPVLADCDKISVIQSCLQAVVEGLEIGVGGEAYLVPYKVKGVKTCRLQRGYQGLLKLAHNTGQVKAIHCSEVRERDEYARDERAFHHSYDPFADRGEIVGFYCLVELKSGGEQVATMSRAEIDTIRNRTQSYQNWQQYGGNPPPWETDYSEMGKKTILIRGLKLVPKSIELQKALDHENVEFERAEVTIHRPKAHGGADLLAQALSAPPQDTESNGESVDPEPPQAPPAPQWAWDKVADGLRTVCQTLNLPVWQKLTEQRKTLVRRRAKAEGWEEARAFVQGVQDVLLDMPLSYCEGWPEANRTLEVLIRVPLRGTPDHFQRIQELKAEKEPVRSADEEAIDELDLG